MARAGRLLRYRGNARGSSLDQSRRTAVASGPLPYVRAVLGDAARQGAAARRLLDTGARPRSEIDALLRKMSIAEYFDQTLLLYARCWDWRRTRRISSSARRRSGSNRPRAACSSGCERGAHACGGGRNAGLSPSVADRRCPSRGYLSFRADRCPAESAGTDWRGALREYPVLPMQVSGAPEKVVYAIASRRARALIANAQSRSSRSGAKATRLSPTSICCATIALPAPASCPRRDSRSRS